MENNESELENNLRRRLLQLDDEWETKKYKMKCRMDDEEEEEMVLHRSTLALEQMWYDCSPEDSEIKQLINEKQEVISEIKNKKWEFFEAYQEEMNKERQRMDMEAEDIHRQIMELQQSERDESRGTGESL